MHAIANPATSPNALPFLYDLLMRKDPETAEHSTRVMHYAGALAQAVGISGSALAIVRDAALLHDVGKVYVPDELLNAPGPLDATEMALVRTHVSRSEEILRRFADEHIAEVARVAGAHHEWFDGSGYPRRLDGERIPRAARIIAICDAFDAMTAGRRYSAPRSIGRAVEELMACSGRQFDPELVCAFVRIVNARRFIVCS